MFFSAAREEKDMINPLLGKIIPLEIFLILKTYFYHFI